ncbi:hypothetical protein CRYUN_Cryun09bG0008700 [Craigia yunnanensis]
MTGARGKAAAKNKAEALKPTQAERLGSRRRLLIEAAYGKPRRTEKLRKTLTNQRGLLVLSLCSCIEEFRATFKKENPNVKAVSAVGKAADERWKSMSEEEKGPYETKAEKRKADYEKQMKVYDKKQESSANNGKGHDGEGEGVNDDEDEASGEGGQDQQDDVEEEEEDED